MIIRPLNNLHFPIVNPLNRVVNNIGLKDGNGTLPVAIDCKYICQIDYTAAKVGDSTKLNCSEITFIVFQGY